MAHHKRITVKLKAGDTLDYPSTGTMTSKLNVTAVSDEENPQYCLSSKDGKFNVNEYHSKLEKRINGNLPEETIDKRELLKEEAKELGIEHPKNIKVGKLEALIEAHKNGAVKE